MMEPIGGEVRRELSRFGPAAGMSELVTAWPGVVGGAIARNAWPARISRDGTLHVATESSAWAFELAQLEPTLLERLREAAPDAAPARMRFAVGRLPEPSRVQEAPPTEVVQPSEAILETARELAAGIADEELRETVARAGSGRGL